MRCGRVRRSNCCSVLAQTLRVLHKGSTNILKDHVEQSNSIVTTILELDYRNRALGIVYARGSVIEGGLPRMRFALRLWGLNIAQSLAKSLIQTSRPWFLRNPCLHARWQRHNSRFRHSSFRVMRDSLLLALLVRLPSIIVYIYSFWSNFYRSH